MFILSKNILKHRHILNSQFYVNIKTTVATTKLGVLWWILDPLFLMFIYYFVVKIVFNRGGENYPLFALCGIVTWQSFTRALNLCTNSLTRNAGLIKQTSLPMVLYVLISPLVQAFFYLISLGIIMVWNYKVLSLTTFWVLPLLFLLVLIPFTFGLFLSIFQVYVRDTEKLIAYVLRFGFYFSPVLYAPERIYNLPSIPDYAKFLYGLNPMVHFITAIRDLLFYGKMFDMKPILILFAVMLVIMQIGLWFFRKASPYIPKQI